MNTFIKKVATIIILIANFIVAQAQTINYSPIKNYAPSKDSIKNYKKIYSDIADRIELNDRTKKKEFKKLFLENITYLYEMDTSGKLMWHDTISLFLNNLYYEIKSHNPILNNSNIQIYTLRDPEPNAANEGPQIILLNLGFLERIRNINELAYILCHEIAHEYLQHVIKGIEEYCHIFYNPEYKKKKKKILRQPYNKNKNYEKLYLQNYSKEMEHSRQHESEADSLALFLMHNAGYDTKGALSAMSLLDSSDYFRYSEIIPIETIFDFTEFPFNKDWLNIGNTGTVWSRINSLYEIPDSLKTHPDCSIRYHKMESIIKKNNLTQKSLYQYSVEELKEVSTFELVAQLIAEDDYAFALYYCLNLYNENSKNTFVNNCIALCLLELSNSIKNHTFSKYVDFPDKEYPASYNGFLQFLHNMNSKNLRTIFEQFYKKNLTDLKNNYFSDYINALIALESIEKKNQKKVAEDYAINYPEEIIFIKKLKSKIKK